MVILCDPLKRLASDISMAIRRLGDFQGKEEEDWIVMKSTTVVPISEG